MAKLPFIELADGTRIPILHEDRAALAIDKPAGWLLAPAEWQRTARNLQAALESGIAAGSHWARSRNLRFLRFVHRLDAETSGVLLLAKSRGAIGPLGELFASRAAEKRYLAVVTGLPPAKSWRCRLNLAPHPARPGCVRVDRQGRPAETVFRLLASRDDPRRGRVSLVEARPLTGRTHQIRVHLAATGHPVLGDRLYGSNETPESPKPRARGGGRVEAERTGDLPAAFPLALRAIGLAYVDPFTRRPVRIVAPAEEFLRAFGFRSAQLDTSADEPG